jgi:hypothetical protein
MTINIYLDSSVWPQAGILLRFFWSHGILSAAATHDDECEEGEVVCGRNNECAPESVTQYPIQDLFNELFHSLATSTTARIIE